MAQYEDKYVLTAKDKTKAAIKSAKSGFDGLKGSALKLTGAVAALAGIAGFGALIKSQYDTLDALGKTADKLGLMPERLAGLRHAANQTAGVTDKELDASLQRLTRSLSEVAQYGTGPAAKAMDELGLSAVELSKLTSDQQFYAIADALKDVELQSDKVRLAYTLMGRQGVSLVNTLKVGSDGLKAYQEDAEKLGIALDRMSIAKVESANDAFDRVGKSMRGAASGIAVGMAPAVEALSNLFVDLNTKSGEFGETTTTVMDYVMKGVGFVADAVRGLQAIWVGLKVVVAEVAELMLSKLADIEETARAAIAWIPGIEVSATGEVRKLAESFGDVSNDFQNELKALLNAPMPSDKVEQYYAKAKEKAASAAEEIARAQEKLKGFVLPEDSAISDSSGGKSNASGLFSKLYGSTKTLYEKAEQFRKQLASEQETLEIFLGGQEAAINAAYAKRSEIIQNSLNSGLIDKERADELEKQLEKKKQDELTNEHKRGLSDREKFEQMSLKDRIKNFTGFLASTLASAKDSNKAMFYLHKAASATNAVISTYDAANKALAAYPPPWNFAAAAAVVAAGVANVAKIVTTSFGSSNVSASSGSGYNAPSQSEFVESPTTTNNTNQSQAAGRTININFPNATVLGGQMNQFVDDMMDAMSERMQDGDRILFNADSRQAQELVA